ncbi:MAG: hypothetical protein WDO24_23435 [Pseudomonadota bacterium]
MRRPGGAPPPNPELVVAQAEAALAQAKARLTDAQTATERNRTALALSGHQTEQRRTQADMLRTVADTQDAAATIELKRAQAIAALARAGTDHLDARSQSMLAFLELLDRLNPAQSA